VEGLWMGGVHLFEFLCYMFEFWNSNMNFGSNVWILANTTCLQFGATYLSFGPFQNHVFSRRRGGGGGVSELWEVSASVSGQHIPPTPWFSTKVGILSLTFTEGGWQITFAGRYSSTKWKVFGDTKICLFWICVKYLNLVLCIWILATRWVGLELGRLRPGTVSWVQHD